MYYVFLLEWQSAGIYSINRVDKVAEKNGLCDQSEWFSQLFAR